MAKHTGLLSVLLRQYDTCDIILERMFTDFHWQLGTFLYTYAGVGSTASFVVGHILELEGLSCELLYLVHLACQGRVSFHIAQLSFKSALATHWESYLPSHSVPLRPVVISVPA